MQGRGMAGVHRCTDAVLWCTSAVLWCARPVHRCTGGMHQCASAVHRCASGVHRCAISVHWCASAALWCTSFVQCARGQGVRTKRPVSKRLWNAPTTDGQSCFPASTVISRAASRGERAAR